jgi:hypothetical protein
LRHRVLHPLRHPGLGPGSAEKQATGSTLSFSAAAQWTPARGRGDENGEVRSQKARRCKVGKPPARSCLALSHRRHPLIAAGYPRDLSGWKSTGQPGRLPGEGRGPVARRRLAGDGPANGQQCDWTPASAAEARSWISSAASGAYHRPLASCSRRTGVANVSRCRVARVAPVSRDCRVDVANLSPGRRKPVAFAPKRAFRPQPPQPVSGRPPRSPYFLPISRIRNACSSAARLASSA